MMTFNSILTLETMKQLIIKPWRMSLAPGAGKIKTIEKIQTWKNCVFLNYLNSHNLNLVKHSFTSRNYAVNYYQTLEEVPWLLRLEKTKNDKNFQKPKKMLC